jgi:hypothetical protein
MRWTIGRAIRVGLRAVLIRWLRVRLTRRRLLMWRRLMRWPLRSRRLTLRRPVSVRILRHAKSRKRDTHGKGENSHTELEFHLPHFRFCFARRLSGYCFLHALRLLRIGIVV